MGSAETLANTRRVDPAADLREATERNTREKRYEEEADRLEKAEAEKAAASAQKKLEEAEAAAAARWQAEEAARRQSALFVTPLSSAPPPPPRSSRGRLEKPAPRTPSWRRKAVRPPCRIRSCRHRRLRRHLGECTANSRRARRCRRLQTIPRRGCFSKSPLQCAAVLRWRPRCRDPGRPAPPAQQSQTPRRQEPRPLGGCVEAAQGR